MRFETTYGALLAAVTAAAEAVANKTTSLPVLLNVHLDASSLTGLLTITGTDLDVAVQATAAASVEQVGATTVPAVLLRDWLATLEASGTTAVTAELKGKSLKVACGRYTGNLQTAEAEQFPVIHEATDLGPVLDAQVLKAAIGQVAFGAAPADDTAVFAAVLLRLRPETGLTLAASDRHVLAERRLPDVVHDVTQDLLVPARALRMVQRLIDDTTQRAGIHWSASHVLIDLEGTHTITVGVRRVEGAYPPYERLIPADTGGVAMVRNELATSLAAALVLGRTEMGAVILEATADTIRARSRPSTAGDSSASMVLDDPSRLARVAVDGRQVQAILRACTTERVTVLARPGGLPVVIRPVGDDTYVGLAMPLDLATLGEASEPLAVAA